MSRRKPADKHQKLADLDARAHLGRLRAAALREQIIDEHHKTNGKLPEAGSLWKHRAQFVPACLAHYVYEYVCYAYGDSMRVAGAKNLAVLKRTDKDTGRTQFSAVDWDIFVVEWEPAPAKKGRRAKRSDP